MNDDVAIKVDHVSKAFKLPHEKQTSIKGALINLTKTGKRNRSYERQKVLDDVSFEIKKGEFFGIVGRNGSGKSTLLKMMAGIYSPTEGNIQVNGKITPFIELGVGFNPELTGRENVFLNGALLGFNRTEMAVMYDDIVSFAEIERFMDQKLKNYSSGMQVRLAFSIAIRAKSDLLILDEVLAVGDEAFQRKCLDVFEDYKINKRTVILVTHDMATVRRFCTRALLINDGHILADSEPDKVAEGYSRLNQENIDSNTQELPDDTDNDLKIVLKNSAGEAANRFNYGDSLEVELSWPKGKVVTAAGVSINTSIGQPAYATNTFIDNQAVKKNVISCSFDLTLGAGKYYIMAGTFKDRPENQVDFVNRGPIFHVNPEQNIKGEGIARLEHEWRQ